MVEAIFLTITISVSTMPEPIEFGIRHNSMAECVAELDSMDDKPFSFFFMGKA